MSGADVLDVRVPDEARHRRGGRDDEVVAGGPLDGGLPVRAAVADVVEDAGGGVHVQAVDEVIAGGGAVIVDAAVHGGGAGRLRGDVEHEAGDDQVDTLRVLELEDAADRVARRGGQWNLQASSLCGHACPPSGARP